MKFLSFGRLNNPDLSKDDQGAGSLDHYLYDLVPKNKRVVIVLADSDRRQQVIKDVAQRGEPELQAFITRRTQADERTDAPTAVRLFVNQRPTDIVGYVPRGLEAPVEAALGRLTDRGTSPRMAARILSTKKGLRVELAIGQTR